MASALAFGGENMTAAEELRKIISEISIKYELTPDEAKSVVKAAAELLGTHETFSTQILLYVVDWLVWMDATIREITSEHKVSEECANQALESAARTLAAYSKNGKMGDVDRACIKAKAITILFQPLN